jgi:hypothetical protein
MLALKSPDFEKGVNTNKCSGGDRLLKNSACNCFIKDYAEVFYMIYEGNYPSIQRTNTLDYTSRKKNVI